ncbi:MAG: ParM/StbA family protein [Anaerolineae bacterium]|nr:ParM/StbA family protein [Anaerolineae bacterium]
MNNNQFFYLGEDLGMGANKLYGAPGGLQVLSQVATNGSQHLVNTIGLRQRQRPLEIKTEHGSFYIGEGAHDYGRPVENLDFDRLTGAPEMRALLYGSLTRYQMAYGPLRIPIVMMVGLPLQMMSGDAAKEFTNQVRTWLKGTHTWLADGQPQQVEIAEVKINPQPVGALFDHVLDESGNFIPERAGLLKQEVGILSVGFNTLELLVVRDRAPVERFTAGQTVGVRRLLELLNPGGSYSLGELDTQLRAGHLDIAAALPVWAREVNGEIEKRWGAAFKRFARVIVVGGGALLLKDNLTRQFNGKALVADDPVLSISRGLYKLLLMKKK